jgi:phosphoserine phosphatase
MSKQKCNYYCFKNSRKLKFNKPITKRKIKLVIFDMDGVLADIISSWQYIHDYFGTTNEKSVRQYLKGEINDIEFVKRDVSLWMDNGNPVKKEKIEKLLSKVPVMKGADKCISYLKNSGIKTAIVSAGLDLLAQIFSKKLGIDYVYANVIKTDENGIFNGKSKIDVRLLYKDKTIHKISKNLNIPLENIAAVGNSCFDIPMLQTCGLGIAFNPDDDCIKEVADVVFENKDLSKIVPFLKQYIT